MKEKDQKRELWLEKAASLLGLEELAQRLGYKGMGPYFYLWTFLLADFFGLGWLLGTDLNVRGLLGILTFLSGVTFCLWGSRYLRDNYNAILREYNLSIDSKILQVKYISLIAGAVIVMSWWLTFIGVIPNPVTGGYVSSANTSFSVWIFPRIGCWIFVYILAGADLSSYLYAMTVQVTSNVREIGLDFSDIHRQGGMKDIGSSLLRTVEIYFGVLTLVTIYEYFMLPQNLLRPGVMSLSFVFAWGLGVIMFFGPSLYVGKYMKERKKEKLDELNEKIREYGGEPGGRTEVNPKETDERDEYIFYYLEHEHVIDMSEYPIDVTILQELIFAALLPLASQSIVIFAL